MITSYNEILNNMKTAYFERCGERAEDFSDSCARLEAAASELFSIACSADYVLRQAFPQTAAGEYLDFHAALRDITRKSEQRAEGSLTFYVDEAADGDIVIPAGTLCSKQDEPYIQFQTLTSATIPQGALSVSVDAKAVQSGWEYNAPAGSVTVMVNPPTGVDGVTNAGAFENGAPAESDSALRKRILESYRIPQSAVSQESIRAGLLKNEELRDCRVYYDEGVISVPVRVREGADFGEVSDFIEESLAVAELADAAVEVTLSPSEGFSLHVEIKTDSTDSAAVCDNVKKAIEDYAANVLIDEDVYVNKIVYLALTVPEVSYCEVSSPQAVQGVILCPARSHLTLGELKVSSYE